MLTNNSEIEVLSRSTLCVEENCCKYVSGLNEKLQLLVFDVETSVLDGW